jgi:transposase
MFYAAIDIHKLNFQAAVLDAESGQLSEERFAATREALDDWAMRWRDKISAVAIEATTGWRWVWRELSARGFDVRLADPGQAKALRSKRRAKTDRLDARWLARLLAKEMLPESWLPPAEIQELRDRTRLRQALAEDRSRWAQRLHALLVQEGWPCKRERLLSQTGRRWLAGLALPPAARAHAETILSLIVSIEAELDPLERELRRYARSDRRCRALETIFGVGPILACHILAELGDAKRFRRARQAVRAAGLDPVVDESGETRRRGRLAKQGSPHLRWALVQAAHSSRRRTSPDHALYARVRKRAGGQRAALTVARKLARRSYHVLLEFEQQAA